jgi:hypothetical protein
MDKVRNPSNSVYFVKNTQGATDISKWCSGEGIGGESIRQSNEILVKTAANRRENGGRKQLMSRINLELEKPCMRDIWEYGRNNNKKVWLKMKQRCVDTEEQVMEAMMRRRSSLTLHNSLRNKWEKEYTELHSCFHCAEF